MESYKIYRSTLEMFDFYYTSEKFKRAARTSSFWTNVESSFLSSFTYQHVLPSDIKNNDAASSTMFQFTLASPRSLHT